MPDNNPSAHIKLMYGQSWPKIGCKESVIWVIEISVDLQQQRSDGDCVALIRDLSGQLFIILSTFPSSTVVHLRVFISNADQKVVCTQLREKETRNIKEPKSYSNKIRVTDSHFDGLTDYWRQLFREQRLPGWVRDLHNHERMSRLKEHQIFLNFNFVSFLQSTLYARTMFDEHGFDNRTECRL